MRPLISTCLPSPSTMVAFSLSMVARLVRPRSSSLMFSSLMPRSSLIRRPPVRTAMSSSIALRRSPKPGDFAARLVPVARNGRDLRDLGAVTYFLGDFLHLLDDRLDGFHGAAPQ